MIKKLLSLCLILSIVETYLEGVMFMITSEETVRGYLGFILVVVSIFYVIAKKFE